MNPQVYIAGHRIEQFPAFIGASRGKSKNPPSLFQIVCGKNGSSLYLTQKTDDNDMVPRFHCVISIDEEKKPFLLVLSHSFGVETKIDSKKINRGELCDLSPGHSVLEIQNISFEIQVN